MTGATSGAATAYPSGAPEFPPGFSLCSCYSIFSFKYVCFADRCLSFCTFSFGHYVVCSSSTYGFWLAHWYLRHTDSDCTFGILDLRILIAPLVSSNSSFTLFVFPVFWCSAYLLKVILEARRAHWIIYLRFYYLFNHYCHYALVLIVVFNKRYRKPKTQSRVDYTEI